MRVQLTINTESDTIVFENVHKIVRTFLRVKSERIFKYHEQRAVSRFLIYYMIEKITNTLELICPAVEIVQIKN